MEQAAKAIFDHLLAKEGVKATDTDFKLLPKYYEYSIGNRSVFTEHAKQLKLPEALANQSKKFGFWSVYLGDPEGYGRHYLVRKMLRDSYFREYLQYPQILGKKYRREQIKNMTSELKQTQQDIEGFYESYNEK